MNEMSSKSISSQLSTSTLQGSQMQTSMSQIQSSNSEHRFNIQCSPLVPPAVFYPSYPHQLCIIIIQIHLHAKNISSFPLHFSPALYRSMPLPSASQSHVPMIRGSPPPFSICLLDSNIDLWASPTVQYRSPLLLPL